MSLQPGVRLGVFEILGPLGAGGMGEVYRARDTRLGREVAIKVLPAAFSGDPLRVARFEREARLLASINHPAIAAIYGAEEEGDIRYLAMELVPGETLASLLSRGPIPLEESLQICRQIADGLEAAHERGVVHRDLKPANVKVTPDGRVKILDLGLAKAMELPASDEGQSDSPTRTLDQTRPGTILGTVEFMSPEQARGKEVDKRTDIWAFGCVLFEMLSGRRAFTGETASDILAAILTKEPDWSLLPPATPPRVRDLLSHCLQKNANQRLRDIGDARAGLERSAEYPSGEAPRTIPRRRVGRSVAAVLALILAGGLLGYLLLRSRATPSDTPASDRSLVVLPATVISDSPGAQFIGDGLVETMSVRLNEVPGIQVVTPTAAVAASDKNADPFGAARSVGADLVVRSSVVRNGEQVRLIYSVWNVRTRFQMVGGAVVGSASDLLGMQDQLAQHVAAALKLRKPARKIPTPTGLETASQQEHYVQALGLLQRFDKPASVDEALRILRELATQAPASALVFAALSRANLRKYVDSHEKSWADEARRNCDKALELDSQLPEVHVTLGQLLTSTGRPLEAAQQLQTALKQQPNSIEAVLGLAAAYRAAGHNSEAEHSYRRALSLQPNYWATYNQLGALYYKTGRYAQAAEMFERVVALTPDNARAYGNLGGAYYQIGNSEKAREAYHRSTSIAATDGVYTNLGTLEFSLGRYKEAAEAFRRATELSPEKALHWSNLGDACRWTPGLRSQSEPAYQRAMALARDELSTNPRGALAHATLGLCLAKTGNPAEGFRQIQEALGIEPSNPDFLYDSAVVSNLLGKPGEAVEWIRRALGAGLDRAQVEKEPEFQNLHNLGSFQQALRTAKTIP